MAVTWTPTFGAGANNGFSTATQTFTGLTLGTGDIIVCVYLTQNTSGTPPSAVTVAGKSATLIGSCAAGGGPAGLASVWLATGVTSATGSIVVTAGSVISIVGIQGGLLVGENAATVAATFNNPTAHGDPQTISVTIPSGGISLVFIVNQADVGIPTTWVNVTDNAQLQWTVTTGNTGQGDGGQATASGTASATGGGGGNGWGFVDAVMVAVSIPAAPASGPAPPPWVEMEF
jgi:hypothetical protein